MVLFLGQHESLYSAQPGKERVIFIKQRNTETMKGAKEHMNKVQ